MLKQNCLAIKTMIVIGALLICSTPAHSQSWRHPQVDDYDLKSEQYSKMWEEVIASHDEEYSKLILHVVKMWKSQGKDQQTLALKQLRVAVNARPNKPDAHFLLGVYLGEKQHWKECTEALETVHKLDPNYQPKRHSSYNLRFSLARCQLYSGNYESAITGFRRIISLTSSSVEVELLLGESLMSLGHLDQAVQAFRHAAAISRRPAIAYALAVALDRGENISEAKRILKRAISRDPQLRNLKGSSRVFAPPEDEHYYLGLAYAAAGKRNRARFQFRLYLKRAPSSPWKKRTNDHLRVLASVKIGEDIQLQGSVSWQRRPLITAIQSHRAELVACLRPHSLLLARVQLSLLATRKQTEVKVLASIEAQDGISKANEVTITSCLESAARKIKVPQLKALPGSHAVAEFWLLGDS